MSSSGNVSRRSALAAAAGGLVLVTLRPASAQMTAIRKDGRGTEGAIRDFTRGAEVKPGRMSMDIPPLVENGNSAPLKLDVAGPFENGLHVRRIAVFNQKNPLPEVAEFQLGPRTAPKLSTRIRLADSQTITAIAELSDGSFHSATADVIVTLAACVEG